jgi:hypothetical protein
VTGFFVFEQKPARFSKISVSFFEKQVPVGIGSESPAIRFISLRSVLAPIRFKLLGQTFLS